MIDAVLNSVRGGTSANLEYSKGRRLRLQACYCRRDGPPGRMAASLAPNVQLRLDLRAAPRDTEYASQKCGAPDSVESAIHARKLPASML